MGQNGPAVTFSGTFAVKQWYSAHFVPKPQYCKLCFLGHIGTGILRDGNGILAADGNGSGHARPLGVMGGNLAKVLLGNLAAESELG